MRCIHIPPSIEEDAEFEDPVKLESIAAGIGERFGGWQPRDRQRVRQAYCRDLKRKAQSGESTGSAALDRALQMSAKAQKDAKSSFYNASKIPTLREHMAQQAETHPYPIKRANILFDQDIEWQEDDIRQYARLARDMLSMGCQTIPEEQEERILSSTDNSAFMRLNLGDMTVSRNFQEEARFAKNALRRRCAVALCFPICPIGIRAMSLFSVKPQVLSMLLNLQRNTTAYA